jgi:putative Holliday junction resolvase
MRALGIDLGLRRIGLAISDATGTLARPLETLRRGASDRDALDDLQHVIDRLSAEPDGLAVVVVGLPSRLDGSPSDQTAHVRQIAEALQARISVPLAMQDERLSSHEAESRLAIRERDWRKRKARLDAAAAAVILQDYLDARPRERQSVSEEQDY